MTGVYLIRNKINNKIYIGKTSDSFVKRWNKHIYDLNRGVHYNNYLQNAWIKYGEDNFEFEIIFTSTDEKKINEKEIEFIAKYRTNTNEYGYNLTSGGESGFKLSEETKRKMSIVSRGKNSNLNEDKVRHIKLALYCLMDRKEICDKYGISEKVITQIATDKNFEYVCPELKNKLNNLKQQLIDERNEYILSMYDDGNKIAKIVRETSYSVSIVEKCIYKYRNSPQATKEKYQEIYDRVFELKKQGYKNYDISKILKISPSTVGRYLKGENNPYLDLPFKKATDDVVERIIQEYYNEKLSIKDIAKQFNISDNTVRDVLNKYKYANTETTTCSKLL